MKYYGYIGTYSGGNPGGIFRFAMENGDIEILGSTDVTNPSFLTLASDKTTLLAVSETAEYMGGNGGSVVSLSINGDGTLTKLSQKPTHGKDPCFVDEIGGQVYVANYSEGTAGIFELKDGILSDCKKIITHSGSGADHKRQEMAHIHCTKVTPDNNFFAVCDLGIDKICIYNLDGSPKSEASLPSGSGPRHIVFNKGFAYVLTELTSELFCYKYSKGELEFVESCSLLPDNFKDFNNSAAIKFSPDGKFLTCSNRGHNSLTVFSVEENGKAEKMQIIGTEGNFPRDFAYTLDGKYIVAANQNSETLTVFKADSSGGLSLINSGIKLVKPVFILFDGGSL